MRICLTVLIALLSVPTWAAQTLPSTAYTREFLRSTNAAAARTSLGITSTNITEAVTNSDTRTIYLGDTEVTNLLTAKFVRLTNAYVGILTNQWIYDNMIIQGINDDQQRLIVRGKAAQTNNNIEVQDSANAELATIGPAGLVTGRGLWITNKSVANNGQVLMTNGNITGSGATLTSVTVNGAANATEMAVRANAGQSATVFEVQTSANAPLFTVGPDGDVVLAFTGAYYGDMSNGTNTSGLSVVFVGDNIGAASATTPAENDNDTSVATTAYVQTEIAGLGSGSATNAVVGIKTNGVALLDTGATNINFWADSGVTITGTNSDGSITIGFAATAGSTYYGPTFTNLFLKGKTVVATNDTGYVLMEGDSLILTNRLTGDSVTLSNGVMSVTSLNVGTLTLTNAPWGLQTGDSDLTNWAALSPATYYAAGATNLQYGTGYPAATITNDIPLSLYKNITGNAATATRAVEVGDGTSKVYNSDTDILIENSGKTYVYSEGGIEVTNDLTADNITVSNALTVNGVAFTAKQNSAALIADSISVPMTAAWTNWLSGLSVTNAGEYVSPASCVMVSNVVSGFRFLDDATNAVRVTFSMPQSWDGGTVRLGFTTLSQGATIYGYSNVVWSVAASGITNGANASTIYQGTPVWSTNSISVVPLTTAEVITRNVTVANSPGGGRPIVWDIARLATVGTADTATNVLGVEIVDLKIYYNRVLTNSLPAANGL